MPIKEQPIFIYWQRYMLHMAKAVIKKGLNTTKSLILQTQKAEANIPM